MIVFSNTYGIPSALINDVPIDVFYNTTVEPGMCCYSGLEWWRSDLSGAGLGSLKSTADIESIEFTLFFNTADPETMTSYQKDEEVEITLIP